jgi:4-diphosphocytidyl-2-C-methyl-D-erythritol kinase
MTLSATLSETLSATLSAHAKLNLYLDIVGKREDGYHNIVTEMLEIDLADTVTVRLADDIRVTCTNPDIPTDERNIAYRAAKLFGQGAEIHIEKRIPVMAGLGGSSTNGAAVLRALNSLNGGVFTERELLETGAKLGADVPFALVGGRARCEGIGELITPLPPLPPRDYLIVVPDFVCDTRRAYSMYRPGIRRNYANIFQDLYDDTRINTICDDLLKAGAESALLTGSGSAVFGVFNKNSEIAGGEHDYKMHAFREHYRYRTILSRANRQDDYQLLRGC